MSFRMLIAAIALVPALLLSLTLQADAGRYAGYVTVDSRYGNGTVRAPVRMAEFGYQVRLPGGTWIYCERNSLLFDRNRPCAETLRRESIDYWETRSEESNSR